MPYDQSDRTFRASSAASSLNASRVRYVRTSSRSCSFETTTLSSGACGRVRRTWELLAGLAAGGLRVVADRYRETTEPRCGGLLVADTVGDDLVVLAFAAARAKGCGPVATDCVLLASSPLSRAVFGERLLSLCEVVDGCWVVDLMIAVSSSSQSLVLANGPVYQKSGGVVLQSVHIQYSSLHIHTQVPTWQAHELERAPTAELEGDSTRCVLNLLGRGFNNICGWDEDSGR